MKTELQKQLAILFPTISIETAWEPDPSPDWEIFQPGNALHGEERDDWQCWQSEVQASIILQGELVTASAYMGGTWEKSGDTPAESNPEISGYERQMTGDALKDLEKTLLAMEVVKENEKYRCHAILQCRNAYARLYPSAPDALPPAPVIKTASDLKAAVESAGKCPHFFTRDSMKFFGDRMANYGVRKPAPIECGHGESRRTVQAIELFRRHPVKHGLQASTFFDAVTFERLHPFKA